MKSEEVNPLPIREQVLQELAERRADHLRRWGFEAGLVGLVNNFNMHLPVFDEDKPGMNNYRRTVQLLGTMDLPFADQLVDSYEIEVWSSLKKSQTPREFYLFIDQVLLEMGIDLDELKILQKEGRLYDIKDRVLEAYIKLREAGYTESDLTI